MRIVYQLGGYRRAREAAWPAGMFFDAATTGSIPDALRTKWSQGLGHMLQNSSKPSTTWIGMLGCRVEQEFVECSDVERHRQHLHTEHCGVGTNELNRMLGGVAWVWQVAFGTKRTAFPYLALRRSSWKR